MSQQSRCLTNHSTIGRSESLSQDLKRTWEASRCKTILKGKRKTPNSNSKWTCCRSSLVSFRKTDSYHRLL